MVRADGHVNTHLPMAARGVVGGTAPLYCCLVALTLPTHRPAVQRRPDRAFQADTMDLAASITPHDTVSPSLATKRTRIFKTPITPSGATRHPRLSRPCIGTKTHSRG